MEHVAVKTTEQFDTRVLKTLDRDHHLHPFTDHAAMSREGGARIITRADDIYLWDSDGQRIIDGMSGLWCVNVGYGRKELAEKAYRQMLELPYYNTFFKTATPPGIKLAAVVCDLLPDGFNKVFFNCSGSEANDTIYRLVRQYWKVVGQPRKKTIISRINAYHGSTVIGASLGGMESMHHQADLPVGDIEHIMQPYWYDQRQCEDVEAFGLKAAQALEKKIFELGADNVAAFIGEPVQGAGGVIIPPDSYWPEINRICKKYDILLICDEVICGFGRTGKWFGLQKYGIEPDLVTMAKGLSSGYLPLSAVGINDRVAEPVVEKGGEFAHGYTYSGHPASCAVALANIDIIKKERLVDKVENESGPLLAKNLNALNSHPMVGDVRSVGLLGAIELVADKESRDRYAPAGNAGTLCRDACIANNVIIRACGDTMVMAPPLTIKAKQLDELFQRLTRALDQTYQSLQTPS